MSGVSWAASAFDVSTLEPEMRRKGLYSLDRVSDRRDPSGLKWTGRDTLHYKYPADHDIVYTTAQTPVPFATLPELPTPTPPPQTCAGVPTMFGRAPYVRRGNRCGEIGWGCQTVDTRGSVMNGLRDGHAFVGMDLDKKHQFMQLPGDTCFDKRAGSKFVAQMSSGRPQPSYGRPRK